MSKARGEPHRDDVGARRHHDRNRRRRAPRGSDARGVRHDDVDVLAGEVGGGPREPFGVAAGESKLDLDRFAVDVAEIARPRQEFALEVRVGRGPEAEVKPMRGRELRCSARATSGHTTTVPTSMTNPRRLIRPLLTGLGIGR